MFFYPGRHDPDIEVAILGGGGGGQRGFMLGGYVCIYVMVMVMADLYLKLYFFLFPTSMALVY